MILIKELKLKKLEISNKIITLKLLITIKHLIKVTL